MKKIIAIVAIVLACGLIAFGIYNLTMSNKAKMINILYNYFTENIDIDEDDMEPIRITTDTKMSFNDEENKTKKYEFSGDLYSEAKKNEFYAKIIAKLDSVALNIEALNNNNDYYFKVKEVKDIFYKIPNALDSSSNSYSEKEYEKFFKVVKDSLNDALNEKDFSKAKETLTIDGSKVSTTKYTVKITNQALYDILSNLVKNSDKSSILKSILGSSETNMKDTLNKMKESIKGIENEEIFSYSIFVKGNDDIVEHLFEMSVAADSISGEKVNLSFSIIEMENEKDLNFSSINLEIQKIPLLQITVKEVSEDKYDISGTTILTGESITINGSCDKSNVSIKASKASMDLFDLSIVSKEIVDDKEYSFDLIMKTPIFSVDSKNTIISGVTLPKVDLSKAVDYESIGEAEQIIFDKIFELNN